MGLSIENLKEKTAPLHVTKPQRQATHIVETGKGWPTARGRKSCTHN
jgi:hypothetical protein